ncbi:MAG: hypothetical protein ABWZ79_22300 [Pedobacter agri]
MKIVKHLILTLVVISVFTNCNANSETGKKVNAQEVLPENGPIEKFWIWFKEQEQQLKKFEENPDKYLTEIHTEAQKIKAGLVIELEPPQNGVINMTVSADGDKNLFEDVKSIIAKAPKIEGWNFLAFRQRISLEKVKRMKLKVGDEELDPAKMKFFPVVSGKDLDIIIYTKGVTEENYTQIAYNGLLLLDNILGEYDCVTKVRSYDFHDMPTKKKELEGLMPLIELPAYVDKFHK